MSTITAIDRLRTWEAAAIEARFATDSLMQLGMNPESTIINALQSTLRSYTVQTAELVGDQAEWLEYYLYECDLGNKPGKVTRGDETITINPIEALLEVITK